jgi:hypothetical protein
MERKTGLWKEQDGFAERGGIKSCHAREYYSGGIGSDLTYCNRYNSGSKVSENTKRRFYLRCLGVAVVIWPLVSRLFERGEHVFIDRLARHQSVGFYPFSLVEREQMTLGNLVVSLALFQQLIGICLLLVAVLYLARTKPDSNPKMAG